MNGLIRIIALILEAQPEADLFFTPFFGDQVLFANLTCPRCSSCVMSFDLCWGRWKGNPHFRFENPETPCGMRSTSQSDAVSCRARLVICIFLAVLLTGNLSCRSAGCVCVLLINHG